MSGDDDPFLPYHCETLNADFLRSPCAKKLAQLKAVRERYPGSFLGPLEHCAACKGNNLIIQPAPPEPGPAPGAIVSSPAQKEENMSGMVKFKDEKEAIRVLGPRIIMTLTPGQEIRLAGDEMVVPIIAGQFCKYHPEVEAHKNKSGRFMGLCLQCLRDRAARNSRNRGKSAVPAPAPVSGRQLSPAEIKRGREAVSRLAASQAKTVVDKFSETFAPAPPKSAPLPVIPFHLACKNHTDRLARVDVLGRTMRFCQECLVERGRKTGSQNFAHFQPPFSIPLNAPEFAELKEWLVIQAAEYERTLPREIMYRLKLARREATVLG
jgi:hypothetical protein